MKRALAGPVVIFLSTLSGQIWLRPWLILHPGVMKYFWPCLPAFAGAMFLALFIKGLSEIAERERNPVTEPLHEFYTWQRGLSGARVVTGVSAVLSAAFIVLSIWMMLR